MTIYIVGAFVLGIVGIYIYAKREGRKDVTLDHLEAGNKLANEVMKDDLKTDAKVQAEINKFSGDHALNYWLRNRNGGIFN